MKSLSAFILFFVISFYTHFVHAEPDLKLGFIGPLSNNAAVLGVDALPAIQIAIEEEKALGIDIQLFVEDDQYVTSKSFSSYSKLSGIDKVDALIFLTYGGLFALKDNITKDNIITIDTLDCDEEIAKINSKNIFCISKSTEDMGEVIAKAIISHNVPKVSVIYYDGDPFMGILYKSTKNYLELNSNTKIVAIDGYSNTNDFRSILLKAKSAGSEAYIFYGYDELGNAMYQARNLGIESAFYSLNTVTSPGFKKTARTALEGSYISTYQAPRNERYASFIKTFISKTGRPPSFEVSTFPSYDAIKILAQGIKDYRASDKTMSLKDFLSKYLLTIKEYDGLSGQITIDQDGVTRSIKNSLFKIKNGELEPVE
ncbi:MAG TPA: ABC transporter substrate-binding protein [Oligoflexia bacterium]|nr:ABC transporter substrate-binding protein [Oligoflexia bacterium]HMP47355.1 ABC transporter substrate-binding protein [Oligoflexia bacterium]